MEIKKGDYVTWNDDARTDVAGWAHTSTKAVKVIRIETHDGFHTGNKTAHFSEKLDNSNCAFTCWLKKVEQPNKKIEWIKDLPHRIMVWLLR